MNISVTNLAAYQAPNAIEDKRKLWVAYGEDNDYYKFLIDSYLNSATNNAAISSISNMVFGRGLEILEAAEDSKELKEIKKIIKDRDLKKLILERKMLGQAAAQVIYKGRGSNRKVQAIKHFPIHTLRPEKCNDMGEIEAYYYHPDWANIKPSDNPKRIPTFGHSKEAIELYIIKPYVSGYTYFSPVDYSGCLDYCKLEDEISEYLLNDIMNGFSGTKIVNLNNGVPSKEQRDDITRDIKRKLTGSKGEKLIVAFNDSADNKTTVEDMPLNDAPSHYEYLASEARDKILVGHKITSPMLLGIKDTGNGLGNNADEIMTASQLFNSVVIRNYQDEMISFLEEILELNGEVPDLYFVTSQPIEFTEDEDLDAKDKEEETGKKGSEVKKDEKKTNLSEIADRVSDEEFLSTLGEEVDEQIYELMDEEEVTDEPEDMDIESMFLSEHKLSTPAGNPVIDSSQDTDLWKVRYAYERGRNASGKSTRKFCNTMLGSTRVYRKEDILNMKKNGVNSKLGHNEQPYSIWLHKGGVNCHCVWKRRVYKKRLKNDGTPYSGKGVLGTVKMTVKAAIAQGFKAPKNDKRVAEAQISRSDKGHHPNYFKN